MPVLFAGRAAKAAHHRKQSAAAPSIRGEPQSPPTFSALPASWSPTVHVSNLDRVDWAVFRVSEAGAYTTDMSWQEVAKPAGAGAAWSFVPAATIKQARDRLLVRDNATSPATQWQSDGAVLASTGAGTGGGTGDATRIDLLLRGQSNGYLAAQYGADDAFAATLSALCGVPVKLISLREQGTGDNTQHSSTSTAWVDPYDFSFGTWLGVPGADYGSNESRLAINYSSSPATWTADTPMTETLAAVTRFKSADALSLFVDLRLHWEYDLVMYGDAQPYYRAMAWEVTQRIRAAAAKATGRHFVVYAHCPYVAKDIRALDAIAAAWQADRTDHGVILAGNMMDAVSSDGGAHWDADGPNRSFPRLALQVAKALWDAGRLPAGAINLSDAPGAGPRMGTPTLVNSTTLSVPVLDLKGTGVVAQGANGIDWPAFYCGWDGGGDDAVSGSLSGATITLNFPNPIGATGRKLFYCGWPHFRGDRLILDNWHQNRPSKYNAVPNIGAVVFPLRRDAVGVAF